MSIKAVYNDRNPGVQAEVSTALPQQVTLQLVDMNGRMLTSNSCNITAGDNKIQLPTAQLPAGNYILRVSSELFEGSTLVSVLH
jgi:hypothetical protein